MTKQTKLFLSSLILSLVMTSCGKDSTDNSGNVNKKTYDNENDALVFAIQDVDGVFNPFYYSSANDSSIIGMTQISMFTTDKNANLAYGDDEPVVVKDYEQVYNESTDTTTYTFVIKNPTSNVRFSNGSYLTLQDVLFNMYEYLDPSYTGSSTMYSTDIVGLKAYRTQQDSEAGQDAFTKKFTEEANERIDALIQVLAEIDDEKKPGVTYSYDDYVNQLTSKASKYANNANYPYADKFVSDFTLVSETFKDELKTDYTNSEGTYEEEYGFDNIKSFLYTEGFIIIDLDKEDGDPDKITYVIGEDELPTTQQEAIDLVYDAKFPSDFETIVKYWTYTAPTILNEFIAEAQERYFETTTIKYKSISGIKVITEDTDVNGKSYKYARYDAEGKKVAGADDGYEMFSITINGVDPKAIWNFSFSVAPMYYYSNTEQINTFDYTEHFGVEYSSSSFQKNVIKNSDKIGLPVGAGAYQASDNKRSATCTDANEFFKDNVAYYVRNDYFLMGKPKIKYMRYQVITQNNMLNALETGLVHYCEPSAKTDIINKLEENSDLSYSKAKTLGYGYIGINAKYIPSVYARRAIMTTMDTSLTLSYYPGTSEIIYRPMSKVSWAYPEKDSEGNTLAPYYTYDSTGQSAEALFKKAGYTRNSKGAMVDSSGKQLKLKFTLAGETADHPAALTFYKSQEILESIGVDVEVAPDIQALQKLASGSLTVWAAAWSTTIDPDMYQTYHKDSSATSVLNWGYDKIKADTTGKTYAYEQTIIDTLSEKIEEGRETLNQSERKSIYAECLDLVMELAVELPTYQREDLFAYNSSYLDESTMTPKNEISPYNGPINQIWNLSLITK